jgi:hypothetical protein
VKHIGEFFIQQITADLLEFGLFGENKDESENKWVFLGPGAARGLALIFPSIPKENPTSEKKLHKLRKDRVDACRLLQEYLFDLYIVCVNYMLIVTIYIRLYIEFIKISMLHI